MPDEIRLHPRALAAYRRASGRMPGRSPGRSARVHGAAARPQGPAHALRTAAQEAFSSAPGRWCTRRSRSPACVRPAAGARPRDRIGSSHDRVVRCRPRCARRRPGVRGQRGPPPRRRAGKRRDGALPDHPQAFRHLRDRRDRPGVVGEAAGPDARRHGRRPVGGPSGGMFGGDGTAGMGFVVDQRTVPGLHGHRHRDWASASA